jgi:hypothetical protein
MGIGSFVGLARTPRCAFCAHIGLRAMTCARCSRRECPRRAAFATSTSFPIWSGPTEQEGHGTRRRHHGPPTSGCRQWSAPGRGRRIASGEASRASWFGFSDFHAASRSRSARRAARHRELDEMLGGGEEHAGAAHEMSGSGVDFAARAMAHTRNGSVDHAAPRCRTTALSAIVRHGPRWHRSASRNG